MNVGIVGIGRYVPENVVTNQDLEKEWILPMNGFEREPGSGSEELPVMT